jgi:hypothetical protein
MKLPISIARSNRAPTSHGENLEDMDLNRLRTRYLVKRKVLPFFINQNAKDRKM